MILNKDSHSGEMVRAKKYEKYVNMAMNNPREKNLMMIVLRPDGENSDVLRHAGKVHLSSTVFSSYPAWIYPVRSSCSKYQRQRENR